MLNRIATVLVEDYEIARLGLKKMLEPIKEIEIIGEAATGTSGVAAAKELNPNLILMDIGLPDIDGIQATKLIKQAIDTKVIVITSHERSEDLNAALMAGADAYCLKGISKEQLSNCVYSVMEGATWVDPKMSVHLASLLTKSKSSKPADSRTSNWNLSEREIEILKLLVAGGSNQQMAEQLYLSVETIKTHMRHIMEKLQVADRTQAAVKALVEGIVTADVI